MKKGPWSNPPVLTDAEIQELAKKRKEALAAVDELEEFRLFELDNEEELKDLLEMILTGKLYDDKSR